jgi:pilus assembly protein FimV
MNGPRLDVEYGAFWGLEKYIMSRRFTHLSLWLVLLLWSEAWAIGLGDIKLDSVLNEPLRAEIVLLSASPDELHDLTVALASAETFERYGIDRPFYLQGIEFNVVPGAAGGSVVQIRSRSPITEPFLTFLVEATWSSGRLLREYTVLLDPPTYAAPTTQQAAAVEAPRRSTPSDGGRIERQTSPAAEPQQTRTIPRPAQSARSGDASSEFESSPPPASQTRADDTRIGTNGDVVVQRGDTLWGLASRARPDTRLTINQTMLAIFEANQDAFGGNINLLRAGAHLRIPGADEVFQIDRNSALAEVQRQHSAWGGGSAYVAPASTTSRPSLTLMPMNRPLMSRCRENRKLKIASPNLKPRMCRISSH